MRLAARARLNVPRTSNRNAMDKRTSPSANKVHDCLLHGTRINRQRVLQAKNLSPCSTGLEPTASVCYEVRIALLTRLGLRAPNCESRGTRSTFTEEARSSLYMFNWNLILGRKRFRTKRDPNPSPEISPPCSNVNTYRIIF